MEFDWLKASKSKWHPCERKRSSYTQQ